MCLMVAALVASCGKKESEGLSRITYYPVLELQGGSVEVAAKGVPFTDPGCKCTLNGEDVTAKVTVSGTVDTNNSGIYTLVYTSPKNEDGFTASASRTVYVYDVNDPMEGLFSIDMSQSKRDGAAYAAQASWTKVGGSPYHEVFAYKDGDVLYMDDILGGYYAGGRGYGANYMLGGWLAFDGYDIVEVVDSYIPGWGDGADSCEGAFDPDTNTYSFTTVYAGMNFNVVMNRVEE